MSKVVRVRLSGGEARLGSVPAADVARLLLGVQRAAARASGAVLRRGVKKTGRWGKVIEDAVRFRLVGIEEGSVVGILELPAVETGADQLELDAGSLGEAALVATIRTAAGETDDADVARALVRMVERLGVGSRYEAVTFETDIPGAPSRVVVDGAACRRLQQLAASEPEPRADTLVGLLVEADFESYTARLRAADGQRIIVDFDEEQADDIKKALRGRAELVGEVAYDSLTAQAVRVDLRAITRAEQLAMSLDPGEFWVDVIIDKLRAEHSGIQPITDPAVLAAKDLTDEEADALLAALES